MATNCYNIVRGKIVRVTRLDACGAYPAPAALNAQATSAGYISVAYTLEYEEGTEHLQKNANGDICLLDRAEDKFKRVMVTISFCEVDPSLLELVTGNTLEVDGAGDNVGIRVSRNLPDNAANFALELWSGVGPAPCSEDGQEYGYFLLPFVKNGTLRDFTIEDGPTTFEVQGWTESGGEWGAGPYNVVASGAGGVPSALEDPLTTDDHLLMRVTTVAPPAAVCGTGVMPAAPTPAAS